MSLDLEHAQRLLLWWSLGSQLVVLLGAEGTIRQESEVDQEHVALKGSTITEAK